MIMSDEDESFVVLGSSPLPSLNSEQCPLNTPIEHLEQVGKNSINDVNVVAATALKPTVLQLGKDLTDNLNDLIYTEPFKNSIEVDSVRSGGYNDTSLAASFILGEIDADVLKSSFYSQFPSLCSMEACPNDIKKLQNLMIEYIELKSTLAKVNLTMKQFLENAQVWKTDVEGCRTEIAVLRNENRDLRNDLDAKMSQVRIHEDIRQIEYDELKHLVSEKTAQINNMCAEIQKLEQMQLASFEYIPKDGNDSKEKPDYISRSEHERIVKSLEKKVSELLAQTLDLNDVQTQYIEEINCLKVNLTAAEELIKQSRSDINLLKVKDIEKCDIFASYETERCRIKEELALLQQQVDVYAKDFHMERSERESLAGERDQLLQDLRSLQRKNQDLIEEAQKQYEISEKKRLNDAQRTSSGCNPTVIVSSQAHAAFEANSRQIPIRVLPSSSNMNVSAAKGFYCPICYKESKSLDMLQDHINFCLKD